MATSKGETNGIPHPTSMPLLSKEDLSSSERNAVNDKEQRRKDYVVDNPVPQKPPGGSSPRDNPVLLDVAQNTDEFATASDKLVILMVGLPARGKTFIAQKLLRYLSFFHAVNVKVFNIGEYRRQKFGHFRSADWFDPEHEEGTKARKECADAALEDLKEWVGAGNDGRVAILDGTHSTLDKRQYAQNFLAPLACKVIMIESICSDSDVVETNIRNCSENASDYAGRSADDSIRDYRERVGMYLPTYETIDGPTTRGQESNKSWIQIIDCKRFIVNNIRGYLPSRIVQFLSHIHQQSHVFYLCRHGQSEYNVLGKIGGDSGLSKEGDRFAKALAAFAEEEIATDKQAVFGPKDGVAPARLWTSTMRRTVETARYLNHQEVQIAYQGDDVEGRSQKWIQFRPRRWPNLDELFAGVCDGMTYADIKRHFPDEYTRRQKNKLAYRYPRGESYLDMIHRLDPILHEMERHREPLLIIAHQGILRILYAFYTGLPRERAPYVSIPIHTVIKLTPSVYDCKEERFELLKTEHDDGQAEDPPSH